MTKLLALIVQCRLRVSITPRLIRRHEELEDWIDYVQGTYVNNTATVPLPVWNVYGRGMNTRTNYHVQANCVPSHLVT